MEIKHPNHFKCWMHMDAAKQESSPLELLLLGTLCYLGHGWTFDDIEEATNINKETHRQFLHVFIKFGSTVLFDKHVCMPTNAEEAADHMSEYFIAGLPGCVGSADATHVILEKCFHGLAQMHKGFKLPFTACAFNIVVNHRHCILWTTSRFPACWNDKTLATFDCFMSGINNGDFLSDVEFELFKQNESGEVISVKYRGAWLMVDNGYLSWPVTVPPFARSDSILEEKWSKWLESMRKDVECTFGILKGRWRILKSGVRLHGVSSVDKVWKTCCALHNWLLDIDGLSQNWQNGVPSEWEGPMGQHSADTVRLHATPTVLENLHDDEQIRNFDSSDAIASQYSETTNDGDGDYKSGDVSVQDSLEATAGGDEFLIMHHLKLKDFRARLVEHFTIMDARNQIHWPERNKRQAV